MIVKYLTNCMTLTPMMSFVGDVRGKVHYYVVTTASDRFINHALVSRSINLFIGMISCRSMGMPSMCIIY